MIVQNPMDIEEWRIPAISRPYAVSVNTEIFSQDGMYNGNRHHYFSCGASALSCILHSLGISGIQQIDTILDFGSGAGRVTRWMRAAFPNASIQACDIREPDLEFLEQTFHATTWVSGIEVERMTALSSYDVIWVGSVFTHLSAEVSTRLFHKLLDWLKPKGILIYSFHGRFVFYRATQGDNIYGLGERWADLVEAYHTTGFGYADYPLQQGYGISLSRSNWWVHLIEEKPNTRLVSLSERAWDQHHDVIAVQKTGWDVHD